MIQTTPGRHIRVRDAELSVRTANALCRKFGNDVTLGHVFEMPDAFLKEAGLGAKGIREIRELIELLRVNGDFEPRTPRPAAQLELRDQFAAAALNATLLKWEDHHNTPSRMAQRAYEIADAMLEARRA